MTDRDKAEEDSAAEGFLERWSRKKIDAAEEPRAESELAKPSLPEQRADDAPEKPLGAATKAEFDLSSLPSLDSITAVTDIRAFLAPGVPSELTRAALRRAWAADPAVRNFVGLAENDWDFTDPNAMPGFGALPEGYDIKKLLAQVFGERDKDEAAPKTAQVAAIQPSGMTEDSSAAESPLAVEDRAVDAQEPAQADFVHRDNNFASHKSNLDADIEESKSRRPHGGALPQ